MPVRKRLKAGLFDGVADVVVRFNDELGGCLAASQTALVFAES